MAILRWVGSGIRLVVDLVVSFLRDLMLEEYRDGRVRTKGLPPGVRLAVGVAIAAVLALLVSIAVADLWRSVIDPVTLPGGQTLRGTQVPQPLVPLTFALVAFGAAVCLSGALRAAVPISAGVLVVYLSIATSVHAATTDLGDGFEQRVAGWSIWAVIAVFVLARLVRPRPTVELCVLLVLVGITFANAHNVLVDIDRTSGAGFLGSQTQLILGNIVQLSLPVLVIAALDVVDFGVHVARWGVGWVDRRLGQGLVLGALVVVGGKRLYDLGHQVADAIEEAPADLVQGLVGSAVFLATIAGGLWMVEHEARDRPPGSEAEDTPTVTPPDPEGITNASRRFAIPAAIGLLAPLLLASLLFLVVVSAPLLVDDDRLASMQAWVSDRISDIGGFHASVWFDLLRAGVLLAAALWLSRRARPLGAAFLVCVAAVFVHQAATSPGRALDDWSFSTLGVDLLVTGTILGLVAWWAVRRRLTDARCEWALFLLVLVLIFTGASFFSDPFSVFPQVIAISSVGVVLFGLAWGFATNGSWANEETSFLPRLSRVQLLIGYQLLSAAILHWFIVTHDVIKTELITSTWPGLGIEWLGKPLVLAVLLTGIGAMVRDVPVRIGDFDEPEADSSADDVVEGAEPGHGGLESQPAGR